MIENNTVTIQISQDDINILRKLEYSLYIFKAVRANGSGAPTVWDKIDVSQLLAQMTVAWQDQYQGFISTKDVVPSNVITPNNEVDVKLGQLITIENGALQLSNTGLANKMSYLNLDSQQYTVGVSQDHRVCCAIRMLGKYSGQAIEPINKVALMFSTGQLDIATVMTIAANGGALVDLENVKDRTVMYSVNNGWSANGAVWLHNFTAFTDMSNLLIECPSNSAESSLMKRLSID